jgi:hypothetical protein
VTGQQKRASRTIWAAAVGTARRSIAFPTDHVRLMIDKAFVPPDTAGWMVRVKIPPTTEEFYLAAIPDEAAAVEAVRTRAGCLASRRACADRAI